MSLAAFNGDAETRDAAIGRLASHMAGGAREPGLFQWDGVKGSISGCLAESADPVEWQEKLGLSPWLAYAFDTLTSTMQDGRAQKTVEDLLNAVPLGADTALAAYRFAAMVLDAVLARGDLPDALRGAIGHLRDLHCRGLAGDDPAPAEWRRARSAVAAANDAIEQGRAADSATKLQVAAGAVGEAAAWDPRRSNTMPGELIRHWLLLRALSMSAEYGWTAEDVRRGDIILSDIWTRFIKDNPEETRGVYQLLEAESPGEAARLRAYESYTEKFNERQIESAVKLLRNALASNS